MLVKKGYYEEWLGELSVAKVAEAVAPHEFPNETGTDTENAIRDCLEKATEEFVHVENGDRSDEFHIEVQGAEGRGMLIYTECVTGKRNVVRVKSVIRYKVKDKRLVAIEDSFLHR